MLQVGAGAQFSLCLVTGDSFARPNITLENQVELDNYVTDSIWGNMLLPKCVHFSRVVTTGEMPKCVC